VTVRGGECRGVHIKFLAHGGGSAVKAVDYLLAETNHQGLKRDHVEVLRGDPLQVAAVADNLEFQLRYRSAVIAWGGDRPSPEQISAVVDDFERISFPGLPEDGYAWTVVQHGQAGQVGVHAHVLIARTELHTGLSFNPAPPGWQKAYDTVRDAHNHENGWARPDDPQRARLVQPAPHTHYQRAAAQRLGHEPPVDVRETITTWLDQEIQQGTINSRDDITDVLRAQGWKVRETKSSISVRVDGDEASRPVRLKGVMYERGWTTDQAVGLNSENPARAGQHELGSQQEGLPGSSRNSTEGVESESERLGQQARRAMGETIRRRAEHNHHRYQERPDRTGTPNQADNSRPGGPGADQSENVDDVGSDRRRGVPTDRVDGRDLVTVHPPDPTGQRAHPDDHPGWVDLRDHRREGVDYLQENGPALQKVEGLNDDRTRNQADQLLTTATRTQRTLSRASEHLKRASQRLEHATRIHAATTRATQTVGKAAHKLGQQSVSVKQKIGNLLNRSGPQPAQRTPPTSFSTTPQKQRQKRSTNRSRRRGQDKSRGRSR